MITIHLETFEDVEDLMEIFQQIGHHFPCRCSDDCDPDVRDVDENL